MCAWCTYLCCMYLWSSILDPDVYMYVSMMHIYMTLDPDSCMYDAYMYITLDPDAYIYDPRSWCMHVWCRYEWCLYPWSLTLKHVSLMRDFLVSDQPTNEQADSRSWIDILSITYISIFSETLKKLFPLFACVFFKPVNHGNLQALSTYLSGNHSQPPFCSTVFSIQSLGKSTWVGFYKNSFTNQTKQCNDVLMMLWSRKP